MRMAEIHMKAVRNSNRRIKVRGSAETWGRDKTLVAHSKSDNLHILPEGPHSKSTAADSFPSTSWSRNRSPDGSSSPSRSRGNSVWIDSRAQSSLDRPSEPRLLATEICWLDSKAGDRRLNDASWMDVWTFPSLYSENSRSEISRIA